MQVLCKNANNDKFGKIQLLQDIRISNEFILKLEFCHIMLSDLKECGP